MTVNFTTFAQKTSVGSSAHRTPPGSFALCERVATATTMFFVAKAKRQLQSAQSERKSTTRYGDNPNICPVCR
ncbi:MULTISPECIES: hypothetical protein [unclassified Lysinibacillus]|uniref:hypothetical protein n=1 Tax=unclassified Lysinibacillus TaxID=2636778 RepID=UPI0025532D10|nr:MULTISPECIES: hypothetical protein [unclassified Lysinibacillus]MDM5245910.1 hypothetical protein [Lysinibacillus sp. G4S2]